MHIKTILMPLITLYFKYVYLTIKQKEYIMNALRVT